MQDSDGRRRHMFRPGEALARGSRWPAASSARCWRSSCATSAASSSSGPTTRSGGARAARGDLRGGAPGLLGGDYDLAAGVLDQDAPQGRLLDRVARFSVAAVSDGEGVADLRGT